MADLGYQLMVATLPRGMVPDVDLNYSARVIEFVKALHPIMSLMINSKEDVFASYCTNQYILQQSLSVAEYRALLDLFYMARTRFANWKLRYQPRVIESEGSGHAKSSLSPSSPPPHSTFTPVDAWSYVTQTIGDVLDSIIKQREPGAIEKANVPIIQAIVKGPVTISNFEGALDIIVDQYLMEVDKRRLKDEVNPTEGIAIVPRNGNDSSVVIDVENGSRKKEVKLVTNHYASPFKKKVKLARSCSEMHNVWLGNSALLFDYIGPEISSDVKLLLADRQSYLHAMAVAYRTKENGGKPASYAVAFSKIPDSSMPIMANEVYVDQNMSAWYALAKQEIIGRILVQARSRDDGDNAQPITDPKWQWHYDPTTASLFCPYLVYQQILLIMHEFRLYGIQMQLDACAVEMETLRMKHWAAHALDMLRLQPGAIVSSFIQIENKDARYQLLERQITLLSEAKIAGAVIVDHLYDILNEIDHKETERDMRGVLDIIANYQKMTARCANTEDISSDANEEGEEDEEKNEEDSMEEVEGGGGGGGDNDTPPAKYLKPALAYLTEMLAGKTVSSFDYLVISRVLNFFDSHDYLSHTEDSLASMRAFPNKFVEIRLKPVSETTGYHSFADFSEDREGTYHAKYFPYLFYLLVRYFAMPYLDITLLAANSGNIIPAKVMSTATATNPHIRVTGGIPTYGVETYFNVPFNMPTVEATAVVVVTTPNASPAESKLTIPQMIANYKEANKADLLSSTVGPVGDILLYPFTYVNKDSELVYDTLVFPPTRNDNTIPNLTNARKEECVTAEWYIYHR